MEDAYTILAGKHELAGSDRYKKILKKLMDADEANLVVLLPAPVEELARKLNRTPEEISRRLDGLFRKGVVFSTSKGYQFARNAMQLHDSSAADPRMDKIYGTGLLDLWKDFEEQEWNQQIAEKVQTREKPVWRVIPSRRAIAAGSQILPAEDLQAILDKVSLYAVVSCPCRRVARTCEKPVEVCLQFNRSAQYIINRGHGKQITKEEAMKVLETAEEGGLIHSAPNTAEVTSIICNCCEDCCLLYAPLMKYGGLEKEIAKSRYQAEIDQSVCTGCQDCVERCPFSAIDMARQPGEKKMKPVVDEAKCYGCGDCAVGCEPKAISLRSVRPPEHILA